MAGHYQSIRKRLRKHAVKMESGCIEWTGYKNRQGYGVIRLNRFDGRPLFCKAHRISFLAFVGPILGDQVIRHSCDNPACINPEHLIAGTQQDNVDDMYSRGRQQNPRGSQIGTSKLSEADVRSILRQQRECRSAKSLAAEFHVTPGTIYGITNRKQWRHVCEV